MTRRTARRRTEPVFDLAEFFVHLEDGPAATRLAEGEDLFERVEADARLRGGRLVGLNRARAPGDLHPGEWERHPAGDELLVLLRGSVDLVLEGPGGERVVALRTGDAVVVPRGTWHRFARRGPCDLLFVVRGEGTELRTREARHRSRPRRRTRRGL
jgi:mannose-6-phosphate isomerase-like protein (cupin superfamily)